MEGLGLCPYTGTSHANLELELSVLHATKATMPHTNSYLAETLVVKETQSFMNVRGVVPVISSHSAGIVPPEQNITLSYIY